jgi:hypothetical protein
MHTVSSTGRVREFLPSTEKVRQPNFLPLFWHHTEVTARSRFDCIETVIEEAVSFQQLGRVCT